METPPLEDGNSGKGKLSDDGTAKSVSLFISQEALLGVGGQGALW